MIYTGLIQKYYLVEVYGFLMQDDGTRHFFHITNCRGFIPKPGMKVSFEIGEGKKGPAAVNVTLIDGAGAL